MALLPFPPPSRLAPAALLWMSLTIGTASAADYQLGDRVNGASAPAAAAPKRADPPMPPVPAGVAGDFRTIDWDALMPADWDPMREFKAIDFSAMQDGDPRAQAALDKLKQAWDQAPIEPSLDAQKVRIAGFVVPLDGTPKQLKEFLLVPYFGACIHTPPPPANQVIHVIMKTPLKGVGAMEPMWVAGTMKTFISSTAMGTSAYRLDAERTAKYEAPR